MSDKCASILPLPAPSSSLPPTLLVIGCHRSWWLVNDAIETQRGERDKRFYGDRGES